MQTYTLNPAERFAIKMEKLRHVPGGVPLAVLLWSLFVRLMRLRASLAERRRRAACRYAAGAGTGCVGVAGGAAAAAADDGAADCRGAAGGPDAGGRAAVVVVGGALAIDGATGDDCIGDEGGVRSGCGRQPRERWPRERWPRERWHGAATARGVAVLEYGSGVLAARFAKIGLRGWGELRRFRYDFATIADCCGA